MLFAGLTPASSRGPSSGQLLPRESQARPVPPALCSHDTCHVPQYWVTKCGRDCLEPGLPAGADPACFTAKMGPGPLGCPLGVERINDTHPYRYESQIPGQLCALFYASLSTSHWPELALSATSSCQGAGEASIPSLQSLWWGMGQQDRHTAGEPPASDRLRPKKDPEGGEHDPRACKQVP